jgi:neural Wiskott-Aldrich syndrome protein
MRAFAEQAGYLAGPDTDAQPSGLYVPDASRPPAVPPPLPAARMTSHYAGRPPLPPAAPVAVPPPAPAGAPAGDAPPLYLIFGSQKYIVDKDQFIIGRGAKTSDLPIRDGNISRKHAAVVRRAGAYYIKDLGSTNGIDFNGERIEARKIEEGDVYSICDYQLRFTFK